MRPPTALRLWTLFLLALAWCWAASVFTPWAADRAPRLWLYDVLYYARALLLFWGGCEWLRVLLRRDARARTLLPLALATATALLAWLHHDTAIGWRWKVAASDQALRALSRQDDHDARQRAGHFIVDTLRHPCRADQPWLWLGRPHGAGSGTNRALVRSGGVPLAPIPGAFAFWPVGKGWWLAYQHASHYQRGLQRQGGRACTPGRVLQRHVDGTAFIAAGRG